MSASTRVKWFLAVLGIFLLILATNLIDKKNFQRVESSVDRIYNERLLAKELLLEVSLKFHKKELAYALNDRVYIETQNDKVNQEIEELFQLFSRAEATKQEKIILNKFYENHARLIKIEEISLEKDTLYTKACADIFSAINANISELASEQVDEGKNQKFMAGDAIRSVNLFSKIEIYILIFLALILQFFIFYFPREGKASKE